MEEYITESSDNSMISELNQAMSAVKKEIKKVIVGQSQATELFLVGLLVNGHVLLEGVPGIAKTMTAKLLSKTISSGFSRIQFTPDLMPSDILGTTVYNLKNSEFTFKKGPIFSNIILIDEINRAPAKTQAALFEVMEEQQVSIDGTTYDMSQPFMVVATQNPIEQEGTYQLPEAQLDRFLFKVKMQYPTLENERSILMKFKDDFEATAVEEINGVLTPENITKFRKVVEEIHIKDELVGYIAALVHNTRNNGDLFLGASPRASLAILKASKAIAAMSNRDFVIPEDIQYVLSPILNHRIILSAEREMEGTQVEDIIQDIIKTVEVPR